MYVGAARVQSAYLRTVKPAVDQNAGIWAR
jgi:hypothetical protein